LPNIKGRPQECPIVVNRSGAPLEVVMNRENEIFLCQ
jgi:hypothetical protein